MIRRETGSAFFLITQEDHARLSGQLAERFGNALFAKPQPREATLTGIRLHDAGWPLHDDEPTLNAAGLPLDVFEVPRAIALKVWSASAERAAAVDPYAGLLVSLHALALSIYATSRASMQQEPFDIDQLAERFEVNKFQHREVERQEQLRRQLGMRTDLPLMHGLAEPNASAEEDQLTGNFRLLQAMDLISLCLCCTQPPANQTHEVQQQPGQTPITLNLGRDADGAVTVDPWPFDQPRLELSVPFRRVAEKAFKDDDELRRAWTTAAVEQLPVVVASRHP
jgi:hypothetical protein